MPEEDAEAGVVGEAEAGGEAEGGAEGEGEGDGDGEDEEEGGEDDDDDDDDADENDGDEDVIPFAAVSAAAAARAHEGLLDHKMRLYGALENHVMTQKAQTNNALKRKRRMNCVPVLIAIFIPWGLFLFVYAMVCFEAHYRSPIGVGLVYAFILACCVRYLQQGWRVWNEQQGNGDGFFKVYLGVTCITATLIAGIFGNLVFWTYMQPCYNINHLATYTNIEPSAQVMPSGESIPTSGKRFQDAGRMYFSHNTILDTKRSMSFKMGRLYCVAPIVDPTCQGLCGNDFWAVGVDCCSEDAANFRCGDFRNPKAKAGLRYMVDAFRPYFRLAVLEAESAHGLMSAHPIFVDWVQDPNEDVRLTLLMGYKWFMIAMIGSFVLNSFCLMVVLKWARNTVEF